DVEQDEAELALVCGDDVQCVAAAELDRLGQPRPLQHPPGIVLLRRIDVDGDELRSASLGRVSQEQRRIAVAGAELEDPLRLAADGERAEEVADVGAGRQQELVAALAELTA